jgi:hypothetical protein
MVAAARLKSPSSLVVLDLDDARLDLAKRIGAQVLASQLNFSRLPMPWSTMQTSAAWTTPRLWSESHPYLNVPR